MVGNEKCQFIIYTCSTTLVRLNIFTTQRNYNIYLKIWIIKSYSVNNNMMFFVFTMFQLGFSLPYNTLRNSNRCLSIKYLVKYMYIQPLNMILYNIMFQGLSIIRPVQSTGSFARIYYFHLWPFCSFACFSRLGRDALLELFHVICGKTPLLRNSVINAWQ